MTNEPLVNNRPISHVIRQRRAQMLIHSYLYYVRDDPIVSDDKWQEWANELVKLQKFWTRSIPWHEREIKELALKGNFFDREFKGWTGATGHHLPLDHPWVVDRGIMLMQENADKKRTHKMIGDLPI